MENKKFNDTEKSIIRGLEESVNYAKRSLAAKEHKIKVPEVDVSGAREKIGMTQKQFASAFGISLATVRNWEQGRRFPTGAARILLKIIQNNPEHVKQALKSAS
jgi:putative transcriptional regulator